MITEQTSSNDPPERLELRDRVAIVTGATGGIGRAIAGLLAREGAKIVANFRSNLTGASELQRSVQSQGGTLLLSQGSVADEAYVRTLIAETLTNFGRLDILVNNAGVLSRQYAMLTKLETWRSALDVNLTGAFLCAREALHPMIERRTGTIINVASVSAFGGLPGQVAYSSSKAGMVGLTRTLAKEVAKRSIRVNAIAPGYIATEMLSAHDKNAAETEVPLGHPGKPEDVAELALFLASDRARYITGQTITIDGGLTL